MDSQKVVGDMTIYQAEQVAEFLRSVLGTAREAHAPVVLDLSAVNECDGAGLQLLLSLARSATAAGLAVRLQAVSPAVASLLSLYGVGNRFALATEGGTA